MKSTLFTSLQQHTLFAVFLQSIELAKKLIEATPDVGQAVNRIGYVLFNNTIDDRQYALWRFASARQADFVLSVQVYGAGLANLLK